MVDKRFATKIERFAFFCFLKQLYLIMAFTIKLRRRQQLLKL